MKVAVAQVDEVKEFFGKWITIGKETIALFKLGEEFFAIDNSCPHAGAPLSAGDVKGTLVTCPWHAWRFDIKTGCSPDIEGECVKTYPCFVEGNQVMIEIEVSSDSVR